MDENFESMIESAFSGPDGEQLVMLKIPHEAYAILEVEAEERGEDFFTFLRRWTAENVLPAGLDGTVVADMIGISEADVPDEDRDGYRFLIDLSRVPEGSRQVAFWRNPKVLEQIVEESVDSLFDEIGAEREALKNEEQRIAKARRLAGIELNPFPLQAP